MTPDTPAPISSNLSWRSDTTPMTPESNPRHVFERLFGSGSKEERQKNFALRNQRQRSILDFVMEDAKRLNSQLGATTSSSWTST